MTYNDIAATDVLSAELLSSASSPGSFYARLGESLHRAVCFRGAVAYWTVEPHYAAHDFPALMAQPGSFLCVDVQAPTSIREVIRLARAAHHSQNNPRVYVHLRAFKGQPEVPNAGEHMPRHLLHPKMLLLDFDHDVSELWVGSHNWTKRALGGLNIEATLVLRIHRHSPLYKQAQAELDRIRRYCEPIKLDGEAYYKWLQGLQEEQLLLECSSEQAQSLSDQQMLVFGMLADDFAESYVSVGKRVYVLAGDPTTEIVHRYRAKIITMSRSVEHVAQLAHDPAFLAQPWALRRDTGLLVLNNANAERPSPFPPAVYCIGIQIGATLPKQARIFEFQRKDGWKATQNDPFMDRLGTAVQTDDELLWNNHYTEHARHLLQKLSIKQPMTPEQAEVEYTPTFHDLLAHNHPKLFARKHVLDPEV